MKKNLKVTLGVALAASALTPVAALAAEPTPTPAKTGFYNIETGYFVDVAGFKALTKTGKQDLFKNSDVFFVTGGKVYNASDIVLKTTPELGEAFTLEAEFEADKKVELTQDGTVVGEDGAVKIPEPTDLEKAITAAEEAISALPAVYELELTDKAAVDAAQALVDAVVALDADATVSNADVLAAAQAKIVELEDEAEKVVLAVESVSAINPLTVEVKFNQAVVESAAIGDTPGNTANLAKYKVGATSPTEVKLSDDGKTATLTFVATIEGENLAVVVEPITSQADDNVKTVRYAGVLTYEDKVKPTLTKVESVTGTDVATTAELSFSEPIGAVEAIKVNGKPLVAGTNYTLAAGDSKIKLIGLDLDASKEHTVEIVNIKDTATKANVTSLITKTFTATVDKVSPIVTSVEAKSDTALVFTFSKEVDLDTVVANTAVKLFDADLIDQTATLLPVGSTFSEVDGSKGTKFEVNLGATPFAGTDKTAELTVQIQDKVITDLQGNKIAKDTKTITVNRDEAAPSVSAVNFRKDADGKVKELVFTFDENVVLATGTTNLDDLLGTNVVNVSNSVQASLATVFPGLVGAAAPLTVKDNVVTATVTPSVNLSGKYTFDVLATKVEDASLASNKNKKSSFTLDFGAPKAEETFKVDAGSTSAAGNVITVTFEEAVKGGNEAGSATLLSAYKLNGKALPSDTTITLDNTQKIATITLPDETIDKSDTAAIFIADAIDSKDGKKKLETFTGTVAIDDNVQPKLTTATLTTANELVLGFSEELDATPGLALTDIVVNINDQAVTATGSTTNALTLNAGTGSDLGKYVLDLSALIVAGSAAVEVESAITAETAGYYNNDGTAYALGTTETITNGGSTFKYYAAGAEIVASPDGGTTPAISATTAGFYNETTGIAHTPAAGDVISAAVKYYSLDEEIVGATSGSPAVESFIDLNGNNSFDAGEIVISSGALPASFNLKSSTVIDSIVVETAGTTTADDAAGNLLEEETAVTAK